MLERIAITGANGTIGTVLQEGLKDDFSITPLDLPDHDVRNYRNLQEAVADHNAIIHLAWNSQVDNFQSGQISSDNSIMFQNVYKAALEEGVPRVIMASSVHADKFYGWTNKELMSTDRKPFPDSPYGAHKVFMELMGQYFSKKGLQVVCIRFGGINPQNEPPLNPQPPDERKVWLSHRDCVSLVHSILQTETVPDNFSVIYAVSDNQGRIHDLANPFGWTPQDKS